jgi:hypothetical protein
VAEVGTTAVTGTFTALNDPVFNSSNALAFIGTVATGEEVKAAGHQGIWLRRAASPDLFLVAQAQDQAPDCAAGALFSSFQTLVLPEQGGPVFVADLAPGVGGVTAATNQGIWAVDPAGRLTLIARKGDILALDSEGATKTIDSLSIFPAPATSAMQTRSAKRAGDLIYKVTFTDGSQGIYKVVFPQR